MFSDQCDKNKIRRAVVRARARALHRQRVGHVRVRVNTSRASNQPGRSRSRCSSSFRGLAAATPHLRLATLCPVQTTRTRIRFSGRQQRRARTTTVAAVAPFLMFPGAPRSDRHTDVATTSLTTTAAAAHCVCCTSKFRSVSVCTCRVRGDVSDRTYQLNDYSN